MKVKCNASGDMLLSDRHWYDAWVILFEIALCVAVAIVMLVIDVYDHASSKQVKENLCNHIYTACDEIPLYLRSTRRYNHARKSI